MSLALRLVEGSFLRLDERHPLLQGPELSLPGDRGVKRQSGHLLRFSG